MYALVPALLLVLFAFPGGAVDPIQPGDYMVAGNSACTLSFVYDGTGDQAGKVYIGTAAHCVSGLDQWVSTTSHPNFGQVAYIGDEDDAAMDFAFIEVKASKTGVVEAALKGHPQYPVGSTTPADTWFGDPIQLSGYGLGYGWTKWTQEERIATHSGDNAEEYWVSGPIHWGDSGGPLVHIPTGKALGIVSRLCLGVCTEIGPTVQGILAKAAADGFTVELRTV